MELPPLPPAHASTRDALHRLAVHVMARRRFELDGKLGLRAAPGGLAAPAAGPDHEQTRTSGSWLIHERTGGVSSSVALDLRHASLGEAAALVGVDPTAPLAAGGDAPGPGDLDAPLGVDPDAAEAIAAWFAFGWRVLDAAVTGLGSAADASVVQLWPEHFDAGCDVAAGRDARLNLGVSPGDTFSPEPYLYVGPWGPRRPGDPDFWNAPFGAVLRHGELRGAPDPGAAGLAFLRRGLELVVS